MNISTSIALDALPFLEEPARVEFVRFEACATVVIIAAFVFVLLVGAVVPFFITTAFAETLALLILIRGSLLLLGLALLIKVWKAETGHLRHAALLVSLAEHGDDCTQVGGWYALGRRDGRRERCWVLRLLWSLQSTDYRREVRDWGGILLLRWRNYLGLWRRLLGRCRKIREYLL